MKYEKALPNEKELKNWEMKGCVQSVYIWGENRIVEVKFFKMFDKQTLFFVKNEGFKTLFNAILFCEIGQIKVVDLICNFCDKESNND